MKTVNEVSRLAGISVRTLHHYDAIGLLKPAEVTQAGYRLYDEACLERLQSILLFRELKFPLREIRAILDSPGFDPRQALEDQIVLLTLQRRRLDELISLAREILTTGVNHMEFSAFDTKELERYAAEAKEKWGKTAAYQEFRKKTAGMSQEDFQTAQREIMGIFAEMGRIKGESPQSSQARELVLRLRRTITGSFYDCTPQILRGLGQMYTADGRFRENIDRAGGEGTAQFAQEAIEAYCSSCPE